MTTQMTLRNRAAARWLACTTLASLVGIITPAFAASGLVPVGQPFNIDILDPADNLYDDQPSVALAADGSGVAAWQLVENSTGYGYVMVQRFAADGIALGPNIAVDAIPGSTAYESAPAVATDAAGNFVVIWYDGQLGGSPKFRLYAADGTPRTDAICVDAACPSPSGYVIDAAMDDAGDFVVLMAPGVGTPSLYFFHADGSAGAVQAVPVGTGTTLVSSALSMNRQNGNVDLAWIQLAHVKTKPFYYKNNYQAYLQAYGADGTSTGSPILVNNCNNTVYAVGGAYGCSMSGVSVGQDNSGNRLLAWTEADDKGRAESVYIYARGYTSAGSPDSQKVKVSAAPTVVLNVYGYPVVKSAAPTAFVVGWQNSDNTDPKNIVYSAFAETVGLNGLLAGSPVQFLASGYAPVLAANSSGNVVTAWPDSFSNRSASFGIGGQIYVQQ